MMRIIIASMRTPKINGVRKAFQALSTVHGFDFSNLSFETADVASGVPDTPMTIAETMTGARNRAERSFQTDGNKRVLSLGVEGGLFTHNDKIFLQSWVCVFTGKLFHFGGSGAVELPIPLAQDVVERGIELGVAIDSFARRSNVRSGAGTFGILTKDMISREDSFEQAAIFALTPYFHSAMYSIR